MIRILSFFKLAGISPSNTDVYSGLSVFLPQKYRSSNTFFL
ncbi:hypothetical protein LEP1GSC058_1367 [Leptospira fainei serovar Hurstbridge str. BUT 6]|uniref:Uncharacterized protein n=1 Tax=Leptospira fainei serovar Hurstbridge str. BUT 6 TaxID=1193011 RepID=S3W825_9LEPT|nr:hypothetical protein LEP1GSC058_1367 [Leptospira fainei serovar Hurstbridge str. BUT 6]